MTISAYPTHSVKPKGIYNTHSSDIAVNLEVFNHKLTEEDRQLATRYIHRRAVEDAELILAMLSLTEQDAA